MILSNSAADIYLPRGGTPQDALARATHLCIAAHQDDIEIAAFHGILECFGREDRDFVGVVVTDGAGSPRAGRFSDYSDDQMRSIRREEQKEAARIGGYAAVVQLDHASRTVKDPTRGEVTEDLLKILDAARPETVYTHSLADSHDTHVAVALRTIAAIRLLPREARPSRVLGCEVWRSLDWLPEPRKLALDVGGREDIAAALIGVFESQISGGKRYDLATIGRRRANATYQTSHAVDSASGVTFALDLTPLVTDDSLDAASYVAGICDEFSADIRLRMDRLG